MCLIIWPFSTGHLEKNLKLSNALGPPFHQAIKNENFIKPSKTTHALNFLGMQLNQYEFELHQLPFLRCSKSIGASNLCPVRINFYLNTKSVLIFHT